jgi:hypothetical protein
LKTKRKHQKVTVDLESFRVLSFRANKEQTNRGTEKDIFKGFGQLEREVKAGVA